MRFRPLLLAAALALLCSCARQPSAAPLSADHIRADTEYLCHTIGPRPTGTDKELECAHWLQQQLEGMGFSAREGTLTRTGFEGFPGMRSENLVATCNPDSNGPILCVMAHYDTVEHCPGARDNSSAVAVVLELARCLGPTRSDLNAQVRLLLLGSEENGYHGADAYVESLTPEELERHLAAFNLETSALADKDATVLVCGTTGALVEGTVVSGNILEPRDNLASRSMSRAYQSLFGGQGLLTAHLDNSDHRVFQAAGIDAVQISWRQLTSDGFPKLPAQYHQPTDTPEGLDYDSGTATGRAVLEALYLVAEGFSTPDPSL